MKFWMLAVVTVGTIATVSTLSGCFDSLVSGSCDDGFEVCGSACVPAGTCAVATPDAAPSPDAAQPPDAASSPDAGTADAASQTDAGATCPLAAAQCGPDCVDLASDVANCGGCGVACPTLETCSNGACCGAAELGCRGACVDPMTDPDNCGACGTPCSSGICENGGCVGTPTGHLVVIGHDYVTSRTGMNRLVGNAVFLARAPQVAVVTYATGALPAGVTGTNAAIDQVAREIGRSWHGEAVDATALPGALAHADVLLIYAEAASPAADLDALAAAWQPGISAFLAGGGVVIVLEGAGETHRLVGARFACAGRVVTTSSILAVAAPRDAVAAAVPASYWAEVDSVAFTGTTAPAVVVDEAGDPVVLHQTF